MEHDVHPVRAALTWLSHPATVAAVAVLLLNDHVLKYAFPGPVTGKLSDVAGLVLTPPVVAVPLALVLPRLRAAYLAGIAVALVGIAFTVVKASPVAAGYASAAWSLVRGPSEILADPTDLFALPALGLAWLIWRTTLIWRTARDQVGGSLARRLGILVVLPLASVAIAATSAPRYDDAVLITEWRGSIVVGIGNAYFKHDNQDIRRYLASTDGGKTFRILPDTEVVQFGNEQASLTLAGREDCVPDELRHCFRAVPGHLRVEETEDGGAHWRVAWEVTDDERARLAKAYPELSDVNEYLSSRVLLVRDAGSGFVVLVANGRDGLARRDESGAWQRIGFGVQIGDNYTITVEPEQVPGLNPVSATELLPYPLAFALIVAGLAVPLASAAATIRQRRWQAPAPVGWGLAVLGATLVLCSAAAANGTYLVLQLFLDFFAVLLFLAGAIIAGALGKELGLFARGRVTWIVLTGLAGGLGVFLPFAVWQATGQPNQIVTTIVASVLGLLSLGGCVVLGLSRRSYT